MKTLNLQFSAGAGIFLFATMFRPALELTQPPIQWIPGTLSPGAKQLGHNADHSPPSRPRLRMCGAIPPFPHMS